MKNFSILTLAFTFLVALPSYSNPNFEKSNFVKVRKRFEKVDKNGDGLLSKEEMIAAHRDRLDNLFKNFDKNGDNKLSRKELRAFKKEMKKRINYSTGAAVCHVSLREIFAIAVSDTANASVAPRASQCADLAVARHGLAPLGAACRPS